MQLSDAEIDQILSSNTGLFHQLAKNHPELPEEDLVQEAMIAVWKELKKYDSSKNCAVSTIVHRRAAWKMLDIAVRKYPWTSAHKKTSRYTKTYYVNSMSNEDLPETEYSESIFKDVEFSTCAKDIKLAISDSLTPKQQRYIAMRFYEGRSNSEIKEEFGYVPWNMLGADIKGKLRCRLGHLESMVS